MSFFRTTKKAAPVAPVLIDPQEEIRLERGAAFKAIDRWYAMDGEGWDTREWDSVLMIRGFCQRQICEATGRPLDDVDFHLRLLDYVTGRGGKVARFGGTIFVSARLPHEKKRGDIPPSGNNEKDRLPDDPRLLRALIGLGVDVTKLRVR